MTLGPKTIPPDCPHLRAGRDALSRGAWEQARSHFKTSIASRETPEAHEGLAAVAVAVTDPATAIAAHERAYALHRERGDRRAAARMALATSWAARVLRGDTAVSEGWMERARELVQDLGPVPERGWLLLREAEFRQLPAQDIASVRSRTGEAREIARTHGDVTLEMEALALEGGALLKAGEITEGLRRLDQAAAAAAGGEVDNHTSAGSILCQVLSACESVRDYDRAAQWFETLQTLTAHTRLRPLGSLCRSHYGGLLIVRGRWDEAEAALAPGTAPVPTAGNRALARLGELRLRQGRHEEAEALFARASHLPDAQLGMAALALERGDARGAADLVARHLRRLVPSARLDRACALTVAVRAHAALGEVETATAMVETLQDLAAEVGTAGMIATARHAAGELALACRDFEGARRALEDAVDGWARAGLPFERAEARLALARALAELGRTAAARDEAARAQEEFEDLGARAAALAAERLVVSLTPRGESPGSAERPPLSARELEVLRLVAQGLGNKEVAARLFLSEHTVKRHLANILARLGLPSRAAAVAYAARLDLL